MNDSVCRYGVAAVGSGHGVAAGASGSPPIPWPPQNSIVLLENPIERSTILQSGPGVVQIAPVLSRGTMPVANVRPSASWSDGGRFDPSNRRPGYLSR